MGLFTRKSLVTELPIQELEVPVEPNLASVESEMEEMERIAYIDLCNKIGFRPAALIKEELLAFLKKSDIGIYHYKEVKKYLDSKFGVAGGYSSDGKEVKWSWCPLRVEDIGKSDLQAFQAGNSRDNGVEVFGRSYHGRVPFVVLDLVNQISEAVPGINFFVSDMVRLMDKGDPFLAVSCLGMNEMIVVAKWDEPSFR